MSADSLNTSSQSDTVELPVWTVHGVNWQIDIPLDEFNAQFPPEMQGLEAATKAVAIFKGKGPADAVIKMDEGEDKPFLGPTMLVHLKDTDPTKGFIPFTHVILANDGFYKDSMEMAEVLKKQLEAIAEEEKKNPAFQKQIEEQAKLFDAFKEVVKEQAKKKSKKKSKKKAPKAGSNKKNLDKPPYLT